MNEKELRTNLINILDDEDGISDVAFDSVRDMARAIQENVNGAQIDDILDAVEASEGRYYLPENHGLQ